MNKILTISFAMLLALCSSHSLYGNGTDSKPVATRQARAKATYKMPTIPYPYEARRNHISGSGIIEVSFDAQGKVIKATMVKSTDSNVLDGATTRYAKAYWQSFLNKPSPVKVPVVFR